MKREKFPFTPLESKAKGKEIRRDAIHGNRLSGARRRVTRVQRETARAVELAIAEFGGTRGPAPSDEAVWATIAWRIGAEEFENAIREKIAENMADGEPKDLRKTFQAFLNKRFPKPAQEGGAE